jgi:agmatinase
MLTGIGSNPRVVVLGVPWDEQSSFLRGAALAPPRIRRALHDGSANLCTEHGLDLAATREWLDRGDLALGGGTGVVDEIRDGIAGELAAGSAVLALGGDHAITFPILRAYGPAFPRLVVVQVDAHPDVYDEFEGNRLSHACGFARIMESGLASHLIQVGIRTATPHQRDQLRRFGADVLEMKDWTPGTRLSLPEGPVYLSLDLDGIDPAHAPGVSHHEPGGLTPRDVLGLVHQLRGRLVGADIVEFNPARDDSGITAMLAAKMYREIVGALLALDQRGHSQPNTPAVKAP